jgi:hypothetical protein
MNEKKDANECFAASHCYAIEQGPTYPMDLFIDSKGNPIGGQIMSAQGIIELLVYYKSKEFDKLCHECIELATEQKTLVEYKDITQFQRPESSFCE